MDLEQGREAMATETQCEMDPDLPPGPATRAWETNRWRWSDRPRAVMGPLETFAAGVSGGVRRNPYNRADD
jgi:hypothetical protein